MKYDKKILNPKLFNLVNKHYSNKHQYDFWNDGFLKIAAEQGSIFQNLIKKLKLIYIERNTNKFFKKEKYNAFDQFDYNGPIEDFDFCISYLKDSKIIEDLKFITCKDLTLTNVTIRINLNKKNTNGFWGEHRDTAILKDKSIKGNVPPLTHMIFYPNLNNFTEDENQLKIWKGSHRKMYHGKIDKLMSIFRKKIFIKSSNKDFLLFDGSILHGIGHTNNPMGNLRLIFSFLDKRQIYDSIEHIDKIKRWGKILNDN